MDFFLSMFTSLIRALLIAGVAKMLMFSFPDHPISAWTYFNFWIAALIFDNGVRYKDGKRVP